MSQITINKGSDLNFEIRWKNPDGTPYNLTGYTISGYDETPDLTLSFTVDDPLTGIILGRLEWSDVYVNTKYNRNPSLISFRVKISNGSDDTTTPKINVYIQ